LNGLICTRRITAALTINLDGLEDLLRVVKERLNKPVHDSWIRRAFLCRQEQHLERVQVLKRRRLRLGLEPSRVPSGDDPRHRPGWDKLRMPAHRGVHLICVLERRDADRRTLADLGRPPRETRCVHRSYGRRNAHDKRDDHGGPLSETSGFKCAEKYSFHGRKLIWNARRRYWKAADAAPLRLSARPEPLMAGARVDGMVEHVKNRNRARAVLKDVVQSAPPPITRSNRYSVSTSVVISD
jgi:hypothetical protein